MGDGCSESSQTVAVGPPLKLVGAPLTSSNHPSMGCGVSNEMPLVEEDAISRDVRKTRESSSGNFQALSDFVFVL